MALNLVLLGPPGAGKGTQAERFAKERSIPKISTGDILREAVAAGTALGRDAAATLESGGLVSDEVMIGIVRDRLARADAAGGFVLDGFPRTVAQATALDALMNGRDPLLVVDLDVPEEEIVRRLGARRICRACGAVFSALDGLGSTCPRCQGALVQRDDDREDVVRERLRVYARATQPLVDYYRGRPTFRRVAGNRPPGAVAAALREAVDALIGATGTAGADA